MRAKGFVEKEPALSVNPVWKLLSCYEVLLLRKLLLMEAQRNGVEIFHVPCHCRWVVATLLATEAQCCLIGGSTPIICIHAALIPLQNVANAVMPPAPINGCCSKLFTVFVGEQ